MTGVKYCSECNEEHGVRAYECKKCDHPHKKLVEDFKTLRKGDIIEVVGRTGDYFTGRDGGLYCLTRKNTINHNKFVDDVLW